MVQPGTVEIIWFDPILVDLIVEPNSNAKPTQCRSNTVQYGPNQTTQHGSEDHNVEDAKGF